MAELEQILQSDSDAEANPSLEAARLPADLFPLPVTPFEHFLIIDDSPSHPLTPFVQLTFRGAINLNRLNEALEQSIARNPLLASRITAHNQSWAWVYDPAWRPVVRPFQIQGPCLHGQVVPMELRREPGIRVWHDAVSTGSRLIFQFHHACADGVGIRKFLVDLLACYTRLGTASHDPIHLPAKMDRLDHARLKSRGCMAHLEDKPPVRSLTSWERFKNLVYFFFRPPVPLRGSIGDQSSSKIHSTEPMEVLKLEADESLAIIKRARNAQISVNDLALSALFYVCRKWQEGHGVNGPRNRIRLLMPFDIRTKDDIRLSAANRMSFSFLGRTHRQCDDWEELLRSVQAETRAIKDTRVYADFLMGLRSGMSQPGFLRWVVRRCSNMATLVFTYTGDVQRGLGHLFADEDGGTRLGDSLLEDVLAAPPVRKNTNIAIGMCQGKGRICISATWNRQVLTSDDTRRFLELFAEALRSWARDGRL